MALNYVMWNEELVRKSRDELLLRCLGKEEYMKVMGEVHEGICGAYQGGRKMRWLIRRYASQIHHISRDHYLHRRTDCANANGQAESSNKVIINIIRKMLEENLRQWHKKLSETL
ncbi:unnamed protein product [Prunus brigantina]